MLRQASSRAFGQLHLGIHVAVPGCSCIIYTAKHSGSHSAIVPCSYGVGGEYPMAAGSAAERAETGGIQKARFRGREVVLTFSMQARFSAAPLIRAVVNSSDTVLSLPFSS